jgi:hypothetical protein
MAGKYQISNASSDGFIISKVEPGSITYEPASTSVTPLVWLDGTIIADEFVDQSGAGRNFTITNKDWTGDFFPYKSKATISAPVGDSVLFAADVNNFLYGADADSPNDIPAIAFFQNIDYMNKIFCKNVDRSTNANDTESIPPHVIDITVYQEELSDDNLDLANSYFSPPTKKTSNVLWVAKDGDDGNAGTEALPFLTIQAAHGAATANDTIYVKTGEYEEGAYLGLSKGIKIVGLGNVILTSTSTTYVIRYVSSGAITVEFTRLTIDSETNTSNGYGDNASVDGAALSFTNCKFYRYKIRAISILATSSTNTITNCVFYSRSQSASTGYATIGYITSRANNPVSSMSGCYIDDNSYDGINLNVLSHTYNKQLYSGAALFTFGWNSTGVAVYYRYNEFVSTNTHIGSATRSAVSITGATSVDIGYNIFNINNVNSFLAIDVFGAAGTTTASCHIHNNYIIDYATGTHVLSVGTEETGAGDNQIQNCIIENNTVLCYRYFDASQSIITHSLYVGFQRDAIIRYNYINGGGINIIYKGSTGTDSTGTAAIYGNVSIDGYANGIMIKAVEGVLVYNNTIWNENAIRSATNQHSIYLLPNLGGDDPENCVIKNNIIVDVSTNATTHLIFLAASITGDDVLTFDYNVMYSANGFYGWRTDERDATFAEWQALGYDANSTELTSGQAAALFEDTSNEDWSLASGSEAIGAGETLAATYDDDLDSTTDWGDSSTLPVIVTKQQTAPWDVGAYVS